MQAKLQQALRWCGLVSVFVLAMGTLGAAPDYHRDVAPILREYCAGCHNDQDLEGELSVETFRQLTKGGSEGPAILPGRSGESLLIKVLTGQATPKMPPKDEPKPSVEAIRVLSAWIDGGATGPGPAEDHSLLATLIVPDIQPKAGVPQAITAAEYSPDGKWLAVARYQKVELLDPGSRQVARVLTGFPGKITALHFSADSSRLVTASGIAGLLGEAILWDPASGAKIRTYSKQHRDLLYDAEISPDGTFLATGGYDRRIVLWDLERGEVVRSISGHNGAVFDLAFSPDGTILASASGDETVKLWRVSDGERLDTLNQPQAEQYSVAFTPDGGSVVAAGADNRIRLWRLVSRAAPGINPLLIARFGHEDDIVKIGVSPDGRWLVSSSADRTIKLWTLPGLAQARVFGQQSDVAVAVAFGSSAVTAGRMDGTLQSWQIDAVAAAADTCEAVARPAPARAAGDARIEKLVETEPNQAVEQAVPVRAPAEISGKIGWALDTDLFRFHALAGEEWALDINAARSKSKLDSRLEVLDEQGRPVERLVLQALRDSWLTFRGKDSETSGDFRLQNWLEMELDEYLYVNGEVVKLWMYPRGPDSGFKVYPGFGKRHTYFGTTALAHPLGQPCYIVSPLPAGSQPSPNGLPVFRLYYENDDQPQQRWGRDSQILFTAPSEGDYLVRVSDVRGFGGEEYGYTLTVRPRQPDFTLKVQGENPSVSPGSGREFTLTAERRDGFDGEIRVDVTGLPEGFMASTPIIIEAGQDMALGVLHAAPEAKPPEGEAAKASKLTATAIIRGESVERAVGSLGEIKLGPPAKVRVEILADGDSGQGNAEAEKPLEFTLEAGQTITARVRAERVDFQNRIELGTDEPGRNLPHGVYVDNIGLNGLLIVEEQTERQFFITAAPWVPESSRLFHLRASADGGQASRPAVIHVRRPEGLVTK